VSSVRQRISAEERRTRILEGALRVFAERGYAGASMTAIAESAGITPAVIYDHFSSKAELQITLLDAQAKALMEAVGRALAEAPQALDERLRTGVDAFFRFVQQQSPAWWLLFRDPPSQPDIAAAYSRIQSEATAGIVAFLRESAPPELLTRPEAERDLEMFAQLLRTAQNGLAAWWHEHPEMPRADLVDRVVEFAWLGLERVAGGERAERG